MNERDFYDESADDELWRDELNKPIEFPRKRENWLKVATVLDQKEVKKRYLGWVWLTLLLASGNVWQARQAFISSNRSLHRDVQVILRDTFFQHDTVYTYIERRITDNGLVENGLNLSQRNAVKTSKQLIQNNLNNNILININNPLNSTNNLTNKDNPLNSTNNLTNKDNLLNSNELDLKSKTDLTNMNTNLKIKNELNGTATLLLENRPLKLLDLPKLNVDKIENNLENLEQSIVKPIRKPMIHITPIGIGIQQGFSKFNPMLKNIGFAHWQGLYSDFTFVKNSTIRVSVDYSQLNYKIYERIPVSEPLRLPAEPVNIGRDFNLYYIEGRVASWQTGLGVQYNLPKQVKWQPFVTGGYLFRTILPNQTEFEYKNKWSNDEKSVKILNTGLKYDHWMFVGAGCSVPIYQTWQLQFLGKYIYDNNHGNRPIHYGLAQVGFFCYFF